MKLHQALLSNALFSGTSALLIALCYEDLILEIPLPEVYWMAISVALALFSGQLVMMAAVLIKQSSWAQTQQGLVLKLTPSVVIADIIWVVGSCSLLLMFADLMSVFGWVIITVVNVFVGSLALLQYRGLQKIKAAINKGR